MSNLGDYQIMTTIAKRMGGPKQCFAIISFGSFVVGSLLTLYGVPAFKRLKESIKKRFSEKNTQILITGDGHILSEAFFPRGEENLTVIRKQGTIIIIDKKTGKIIYIIV